MSPACRDGIITADMNRENPNVITNTGSLLRDWLAATGITTASSGNHRSHWAISPGS